MTLALILFVLFYILMLAVQQYRPWVALGGAGTFLLLGKLGVYDFTLADAARAVDFNVLLMMAGMMGTVFLFIQSKMPARLAEELIAHVPDVRWAVSVLALLVIAFMFKSACESLGMDQFIIEKVAPLMGGQLLPFVIFLVATVMTFALANVAGIILHISALAAVVVLWLVWKNKRVVHLLPSEPDKRLGAPHGASQSRPVNYCMQDSRGPNSIGRRQMRQHMRDVS